ncbi:MAG: indolepyruvate oxidoreductase subunit beta [Spirochaetes bacterium]|nr:indolepyruvate oxidoreductase subunit beta [Spirochaetota bacterium]
MSKIKNVLMVGVGGQGIILSSDIFAQAALNAGFDVKKSEIHGMSQRGGSVFSHIRFGEKVFSPVIPKGEADIIVAAEEMEILRWAAYASSDTKAVISQHRILPTGVETYPEDIRPAIDKHFADNIKVDVEMVKEKTGNMKFLNVVLMGIISNFLDLPHDAWQNAINDLVPKGTYDKNMEAFALGKSLA